MNVPTKETYSELYSILNMMGEEYIKKLPENIYARIENERDIEYNPVYVKDVELEKQNVSEEALASIAYFNLNFWSETIEEKAILNKLFASEEHEEQKETEEQQDVNMQKEEIENSEQEEIQDNNEEQEDNINDVNDVQTESVSEENIEKQVETIEQEKQNNETETEKINQEETSLIIHKEGFFTRILNRIKEFFTRKKHKIEVEITDNNDSEEKKDLIQDSEDNENKTS